MSKRSRPHRLALLATLTGLATASSVLGGPSPSAQAAGTGARTYYVSATGDDAAAGTSTTTAWRTLQRASDAVLRPGDTLLLEGGSTFSGTLYLDAADAGDPARPVVVESYGSDRARIATGTTGIYVYDTAGVEVRHLVLRGDATAYRRQTGIGFYNDLPGGRRLGHVRVASVDVAGFRNGISIGGGAPGSGFSDVAVTSAKVHDNMDTGLLTFGPALSAAAPTYSNADVRVARVQAWQNPGDPTDLTRNTGSGIVLGSVQGGTVEQSSAWANGAACRAPEGPVGIWTYDADHIAIRDNVSHDNRTGGPADGDGFDLDQNVSDSVLERNLSYGNDGAGILLYTGLANDLHRGNVVRFNVSQGDARRGRYGVLTVWGRVLGAQVHDNTVVALPVPSARPPVVQLMPGLGDVALRNNVFVSAGAGAVVDAPTVPAAGVVLQGNDYWATSGSPWQVRWGATSSASLAAWRTTSHRETLAGRSTGLAVDPGLADAAGRLAITDPARLRSATGMLLTPGSALLGAGVDLAALGVATGGVDYFGGVVPLTGPYDVGAQHATR